jgi:hypothetical protein
VHTEDVIRAAVGYATWVVLKTRPMEVMLKELRHLTPSLSFSFHYIRTLILSVEDLRINIADVANADYYSKYVMVGIGRFTFDMLMIVLNGAEHSRIYELIKRVWRTACVYEKNREFEAFIILSKQYGDKQRIKDMGASIGISDIHEYHIPLPIHKGKLQHKYMRVDDTMRDEMEANRTAAKAILRKAQKGA